MTLFPRTDAEWVDAFAAYCHARTPGVEISNTAPTGHDAPHGVNEPHETEQ